MVKEGTYKADVLVTLHEQEDETPLSVRELGEELPPDSNASATLMRRLWDDDYVRRSGRGERGDPYRYRLTGKGQAAARDLTEDDPDPDESGLGLLFEDDDGDDESEDVTSEDDEPDTDDTDDEPKKASNDDDPTEADESDLDGEDAVLTVEDVAQTAYQLDRRMRRLEGMAEGADNVVALTDDQLVDAVYLIANADAPASSYDRRTRLIAALIGAEDDEDETPSNPLKLSVSDLMG